LVVNADDQCRSNTAHYQDADRDGHEELGKSETGVATGATAGAGQPAVKAGHHEMFTCL
jgi:hypothetical protein